MYQLWDHHHARWRRYDRPQILADLVGGRYLLGDEQSTALPGRSSRADHRFVGSLEESEHLAGLLLRENLAVRPRQRRQSGRIRRDRSEIHRVLVSGPGLLSTYGNRSPSAPQCRSFRVPRYRRRHQERRTTESRLRPDYLRHTKQHLRTRW